MNHIASLDSYGVVTEPATLTIERLLPGPIDRVWAYLTESDLRRQWLAAGEMHVRLGAPFELVWRNDELTDPPGYRAEGPSGEHRMQSEITELDPPNKLAFTWGRTGGVSIALEPRGDEVLLTLVHHRLPDRAMLLNVSSGWHAHLAILRARLGGVDPEPFWDQVGRLKGEYQRRLPA